ncbi:hypothetical protein BTM25_02060 [Actinomadura rubteroloni]|uniref:Uncharacterized protein n=1 Tax=Actinomadura rubteroloni TaxID=1926885 RepID=A0A2P4ULA2_9ACTN|nr:hypothetical protein [Actinomadura rubteroloni]POM25823.1 hypothetical protein BTM25_02060 [Actinomadura rubteroloni]
MTAPLLACAAQVLFVVAFVLFKSAARSLPTLSARRPLQTTGRVARSPGWVLGLIILLSGFTMADLALLTLPIASALPAYAGSLVVLLVIGAVRFGERLTRREWFAMAIVVAAMATAALSVAGAPGPWTETVERPRLATVPPLWAIALVVVPSLFLPLWMFMLRDRVTTGRHARAITGIAYGIGAGAMLGVAETFGLGMELLYKQGHHNPFTTPHVYLFVLAGLLGIGLLSIGLQRCRLTILVTVLTVTAKAHILVSATLLFGEPWPHDRTMAMLRGGSVLLAGLAVLTFPRHELRRADPPRPTREPAPDPEPARRPTRRTGTYPVMPLAAPTPGPAPEPAPEPPAAEEQRRDGSYVGRRRRDHKTVPTT